MDETLLGMTREDVCSIAYQPAARNGMQYLFNQETNLAGTDWLQGFLKRHPQLSLWTPQQTSAARAHAFNGNRVAKFFNLLDTLMEKHAYNPGDIYNVDEMEGAERNKCGAIGNYIAPLLIFLCVRWKPELTELHSEHACMTS